MIAVFNRLPVKEGMAGQIVQRFANSREHVQGSRASFRWKS
jgi:heme-degrading monooxygenase HmoA